MHCKVTVVTQCGIGKSIEQIETGNRSTCIKIVHWFFFIKVQMQFNGESIVTSINSTGTVGCLYAPQKESEPILKKLTQ